MTNAEVQALRVGDRIARIDVPHAVWRITAIEYARPHEWKQEYVAAIWAQSEATSKAWKFQAASIRGYQLVRS